MGDTLGPGVSRAVGSRFPADAVLVTAQGACLHGASVFKSAARHAATARGRSLLRKGFFPFPPSSSLPPLSPGIRLFLRSLRHI